MFPSANRSAEPDTGVIRRHHIYPDTVHRAIKRAASAARIIKPVSSHTLRHSFATHLLEAGYDIPPLEIGPKRQCVTAMYTS